MSEIIIAIVDALFTGILSIILINKFSLSYSDSDAVRQAFEYQKNLYLKIVATKRGEPISVDIAKIQIDLLLEDILENDELFLTISEEAMLSLKNYKEDPSPESISTVQKRLKHDFEEIKYKLGYPNNLLERHLFYGMKVIQCTAIISIAFFFLVWKLNLFSSTEALMPLLYWGIFSGFVAVIIWPYFWNHNTYNKQFRKDVLEFFIQLPSKLLCYIKQLMRLK